MGNAYSGMKDYAKARDCYRELVNYYEQYDKGNEEYPKAILRLAKAEKFNKEYSVSIDHHKQAMALFDERGMANDYTEAAASLQLCYAYAGINEAGFAISNNLSYNFRPDSVGIAGTRNGAFFCDMADQKNSHAALLRDLKK